MIQFLVSISLIITLLSLSGCSKNVNNNEVNLNIDTITFSPSMKGWELYSWTDANRWNYSLLMGTDRLKSYAEVTENLIKVSGEDSLKLLLDKLPAGEEIHWAGKGWLNTTWNSNYGTLALPDGNTVNEIKSYCNLKGLVLIILE